ncbi:hypothetical protein KEU06_27675 [Pseudaminobacter sp. 19-2017]|uniref:Uncharacterized protein n=1 Tax=Pseudaminobacter soli (ex Zhang et al. 2022) TaxID=2831468 RepID=A0A942E6T6_9HYPH|nr:hypothetical protein [Pseudaminobacter soli]MBS3652375.1 hypothetical protein [Pseudaminobacter soli]
MTPEIQPFKQGQLDGLCGLYAIINAIRVALGEEERRYRRSDWEELFYELLCTVDDEIGAVRGVGCGLTTKSFHKAAHAAVEYMRDTHGVAISIGRLIPPHTKPTLRQVMRAIEAATAGQAVVACLSGKLNHWTVCRRATAKSLILFDSSSYLRLARSHCRMADEPKLANGPQYIIHSSRLWLVARLAGSMTSQG